MDKRLTLSQQWDKEIRRLLNKINRQSKKGIEFNPLPTKPKKVTQESVERLRTAKPIQFRKQITTERAIKEPTEKQNQITRTKIGNEHYRKGRIYTNKAKSKLTEEQLKQIRSQAAKKAAVTRKAKEAQLSDDEKILLRIARQNKAKEMTKKQKEKIASMSAEELKALKDKRKQSAKKAAVTRAERLQERKEKEKALKEETKEILKNIKDGIADDFYYPKQANLIYENVMDLIEQTESLVQPVKAGSKAGTGGTRFEIEMGKEFRRLINKSIEKYGMEETAKKLEAKGKELQDFIEDVIYRWYKEDYRSIEGAFKVFAEILGVDVAGNENATLIDAIFEQYGLDEDGNEV